MKKVILHLCADTGSDTQPYQDDPDYEVVLVGSKIGVENFSVARWLHFQPLDTQIYGVIANPPCLEFSRARTGGKARNPDEGMFLVKECQRIIEEAKSLGGLKFWVIENPATGALRNCLGKPQYWYQPWWYGSPWTKKTALWGEFNIPKRVYDEWEDVPKNTNLWVRKRNRVTENDRYTGKPELHTLHKSAKQHIREFDTLLDPDSDMEFRSLCSQKFAQAFKDVNG
jgi:hypothetical protein